MLKDLKIHGRATDAIATGQDLLSLIAGGDKDAFTNFYLDNFRKLILVSDKYVQSIPVAEELVQDIFLRIWEDQEALLEIKSVKAYLYRSVVNSSINYINRQRSIEKHHLQISGNISSEDIDLQDTHNELIVLLYDEIARLPEKCQRVFKMSRLEGMKYRDIANQLGISEKTVENHMGNALKTLRYRILEQAIDANTGGNRFKYFSLMTMYLY
ncbi:MAG: RNA polymerase sigma-70 factor [Candidatus Pedobacter colombiensis]|uniref:RNA polymerase sigma-70 factor n=1 Tax=Candidatus Pedobacter colombiensis TaxID=3121371 RepID=A0AAJ6B8D4_9SPHI|nr:RNA polymerase sigma-70 factor [Pedobacter sp.]WEK19023.1 MAG: RNA polymerase sigma-70 factor [Pedobacter sp.]